MLNQPLLILLFCMLLPVAVISQSLDSTQQYYQWVNTPYQPDHLPSGYFYYVNLADSHLKKGDTLAAVDAQRMAVIAGYKLGVLVESEAKAVQALKWLDALENAPDNKNKESRYAGYYNLLGMIYHNKKHFEKAFGYYNRALTYVETTSDSISGLNNRGMIYMDMKDWIAAEQDFIKVIEMGTHLRDTAKWARALNNLGVLKLKQDNKQGAGDLWQALQLREQIKDLEGMYSGNRHLAFFALSENDTVTAQTYATTTLNIARALNSPSYILESLSILMDLNKDTLVSQYKTLTDSLNNAKQQEQNLFAAMRFDVEKEVLNTQRAELQLEKERSKKTFIVIIGILVVLLMVLVIILILSRIKSIRQKEVFKTESRISKKVHDELANEVYQVMVKMQIDTNKGEELLDDMEHIYNKSRDISKEYQVLDDSIPFDEIISDLLSSYQSDRVKILRRDTTPIDWKGLSSVKKNAIYRVLQELMTNMKKHSEATLVAVTFSQNRQKVEINYSDNGVGTLLKKQTGLQNAENRIFSINGSITFETQPEKGFKVKLIV